MFNTFGRKLTGLAALAVLAGAVLAPAAHADPITFYNNATTHGTQRFTLNCGSATGDCGGLLEAVNNDSPLSWSSTIGQMLTGPGNSGDGTVTGWISNLVGSTLTMDTKTNANGESLAFQVTGNYFLIKLGNKGGLPYAVLQNLTGNPVDVWFTATHGTGSGISHYVSFAGGSTITATVPEPGVVGAFGLGLLLVGMGYGLRRRRAA